ncbi:hypothetical protein CDL12_03516 [Handroanthus impetiginosus]|uniref:Uncharacterized protein n=1 Tax=Handroanthus impetiginosus TaxID=429701 RepID=A0A2G9HL27_9LAMI|nr:hypothetical protein CDL12_09090 [Handroanthus impetiginosus]PIN23761.1 hypothetical protein CDL12_03516 [Handroanthus impetiginosus]
MGKDSKSLTICVVLLLLLLVLSKETAFVEGRHLKCKECPKGHHKSSFKTMNGGEHGSATAETGTSKVEYEEDFPPTVQGHSPGIGHSVHD